MTSDKRRSRRETRRKTEYGYFTVERERQRSSPFWYVTGPDGGQYGVGTGKDGKKRAKALAAALDAAGMLDLDCLPPCADGTERPTKFGGTDGEWEEWTAEAAAVPAGFMTDKYAVAGYLHAVHRYAPAKIGRELDVSEQSARQYLSDLRAGRRS